MIKKYVRIFSCAILIGVSLLSAAASCQLENGGFTLLTGDYSAPSLQEFFPTGNNCARISFSKPVSFALLKCTRTGTEPVTFSASVTADGTSSYVLHFSEEIPVGFAYLLEGVVKDAGGSSLRFGLDFYGYNERAPAAFFSEVGPDHAASKDPKKAKAEFVELYILEDGNIGGMIVQSGYDGVLNDFVLPAAEVKAGDYVTVHLRLFGEKAVSETGGNLSLSTTVYSCAISRDIWNEKADKTKTCLGSDDVLLLRKRQRGELVDALLYSRDEKTAWAKDLMNDYAAEAFESGIWIEGMLPENGVVSDAVTAVRTLSRVNVQRLAADFKDGKKQPFAATASDWKVLSGKKKEKASPGRPNVFE